jgi:Bacterial Ig domain/Bacterial Ig-like domain/Right handed beta helix region
MLPVAPQGGFRASLRALATLVVLVAALAVATSAARAADLNATTSSFSSVYSSAQGGDVIHLAAGNYGNWTPSGGKSSVVTITAQAGATVQMYPTISVSNLKLDGLTLNGAYLNGAKNVSIVNSTVTQMMRVDTPTSAPNANVLIDHNTFSGINVCSSCYEGRLAIRGYNNTQPVGVTVSNNLFGPGGDSDGVQIIGDAYGVQIGPGNEFRGLAQVSTAHTDAVQLYGSSHTLITGNWMHDNSTGIMAPDGSDHETITNNVIETTGYPWPIVMGNAVGNTVTHNVLPGSDGTIEIDKSNGGAASSGNVITDNVIAGVTNASGGAPQGASVDYNLTGKLIGAHDVKASPTYAGGSSPSSYAGYALTSTSAGATGASDGGAIGVRPGSTGVTDPPPPPADTTAPDTTIGSGPTGGASTTDTTPTFAFTSSESGSTFQCKVDSGSWSTCTSPNTLSTLAAGSHTFSVRATDTSNNTDATPAAATFTVTIAPPADTTAPDTSITSGPTGGDATTDTTPTFAFTATESGSTFQCKVDSGSWSTCTSPRTLSALAAGSHTFKVRATDTSNNTDATPAAATFTVTTAPPADTTAPDTTLTATPAARINDTTPTFAFTSSEDGSTFQCRVDLGSWSTCTSPTTLAPLTDGHHSFSVRAQDAAGNVDASAAAASFTIDTKAPKTKVTTAPDALSLSGDATVAFTVDEPDARSECQLDGGGWTPCSSPYSVSGLGIGSHALAVRSTDDAQNVETPPTSTSWNVLLPTPPITLPGDDAPVTDDPGTEPEPPVLPTQPTTPAANHAPKVALTRPSAGTRFTRTLTVAATATDDRAVQRVEFWVDGKRIAADTKAPYGVSDWSAPSSLSYGTHTLVARAFDRQGAAASAAVTIVRVRPGSAARSSSVDAWRATSAGTALRADGPARESAKVTVTRCADAKAGAVRTVTVRSGADGRLADDGLCVLSVRTA